MEDRLSGNSPRAEERPSKPNPRISKTGRPVHQYPRSSRIIPFPKNLPRNCGKPSEPEKVSSKTRSSSLNPRLPDRMRWAETLPQTRRLDTHPRHPARRQAPRPRHRIILSPLEWRTTYRTSKSEPPTSKGKPSSPRINRILDWNRAGRNLSGNRSAKPMRGAPRNGVQKSGRNRCPEGIRNS